MPDVLSRVDHPHDLRGLSIAELEQLATEIRQRIMEVVNVNGGHLASNLGMVELTLALHRVFDLPHDRLVWDVSHQTYPHKLLTGRKDRFHLLRKYNGISGFCNKRESVFDLFDAGHAGTAVSLGLGVAVADHLLGRRSKTIAVVGDAAIAAGMAFEALNHAGELKRDFMVVLNDNRMSIDVSVGALSKYLNKLRTKPKYQDLKKDMHDVLSRIPVVGKRMEGTLDHVRESIKHSFVPGLIFQELGFNYYGPVDGHDLSGLLQVFEDLKQQSAPILLHLHSVKGCGYDPATNDPVKYHALKGFLKKDTVGDKSDETDKTDKTVKPETAAPPKPRQVMYSDVFAETLIEAARKDRRLVAITAGMPGGTGLTAFAKEFPERYFDVGIAEQHGAAVSSGMAYGGLKAVFAVYSTFCQRAYDQFVHDVCIQENPVILCLDRAGLVEDGWTHHGVFDIAYMRCIPNCILMAPRDAEEYVRMFQLALEQTDKCVAIRYPKAAVPKLPSSREPQLVLGKAETLRQGEGVAILAYGAMVELAYQAASELEQGGVDVTVVNARFAKPFDTDLLCRLAPRHHSLITIEEHALAGGFGSAVLEHIADLNLSFSRVVRMGVPDHFQNIGAREHLLQDCGLTVENIVSSARELHSGSESTLPTAQRPVRTSGAEASGRSRSDLSSPVR